MASRRHQRPRSLEPNGFAFSLEPRPARRPSSGSSSSPTQPSGSTSSSPLPHAMRPKSHHGGHADQGRGGLRPRRRTRRAGPQRRARHPAGELEPQHSTRKCLPRQQDGYGRSGASAIEQSGRPARSHGREVSAGTLLPQRHPLSVPGTRPAQGRRVSPSRSSRYAPDAECAAPRGQFSPTRPLSTDPRSDSPYFDEDT